MKEKRENWIDSVKILACVLVATGHFFQSMVACGLMPQNNLYCWFNNTVYFFHVQLFFVCSGYLYQKKSRVRSFKDWKSNMARKAVVLGVPYFIFSIITWILKEVFSGSVNGQNQDVLQTLFLMPSSPYWYLYALFFIFAVTPTFSSRKDTIIGLLVALLLKWCSIAVGDVGAYCISTVLANEIWFVLGMVLCVYDAPSACRSKKWLHAGVLIATVFVAISILVNRLGRNLATEAFGMGFLGVGAVFLLAININENTAKPTIIRCLANHTMPVFLMHTITAAGMRTVLFKLGIMDLTVHVIIGLAVSFVGPVIAVKVMKQMKLDILIYPGKYIKFGR